MSFVAQWRLCLCVRACVRACVRVKIPNTENTSDCNISLLHAWCATTGFVLVDIDPYPKF